jgi:hypothetical protein
MFALVVRSGLLRLFGRALLPGCALLLAILLAEPAQGQDKPVEPVSKLRIGLVGAAEEKSIECEVRALDGAAYEFAFNPRTGDLAAIDPTDALLRVYASDALKGPGKTKFKEFRVPNQPVGIVFKRYRDADYCIVASVSESEYRVFDARSWKEVRKGRLPERDLTGLWTSTNPEDPWVYYGVELTAASVRRFNVETWSDGGEVGKGNPRGVSPDGTQFAIGDPSGSGVQSLEVARSGAVPLGGQSVNAQAEILFDAAGRLAISREFSTRPSANVLNGDLTKHLERLDYTVLMLAPERAWLVGHRRQQRANRGAVEHTDTLVFAETHTRRPLGQWEFPGQATIDHMMGQAVRVGRRTPIRRYGVFHDGDRNRLLLAFKDRLTIVPLEEAGLPVGPTPHVRMPLRAELQAGRAWEAGVTVVPATATATLIAGPPGLTFADGKLSWTPGDNDIGKHAAQIEVVAGDVSTRQATELTVNGAASELPIPPEAVGHVTWTADARGRWIVGVASKLVWTVDSKSLEIVARTVIDEAVDPRQFAFHNEFVVVATGGPSRILPLPDLRPERVLPASLRNEPFEIVADKWLVTGRDTLERFRLPEMQPVPFPEVVAGAHQRSGGGRLQGLPMELMANRFAEGWLSEGVYYDAQTPNIPKLLVRPWGFLGPPPPDAGLILRDSAYSGNGRFRKVVGSLLEVDRARAFEIKAEPRMYAPPTGDPEPYRFVQVIERGMGDNRDPEKKHSLAAVHINHGAHDVLTMLPLGDAVGVLIGRRLHRLPIPAAPAAPSVPRFTLAQSQFVVRPEGSTLFEHVVTGGRPPYTFTAIGPEWSRGTMPLNIDPATGAVTFDGPSTRVWVVEHVLSSFPGDPADGRLTKYSTTMRDEFAKLTGRPPAGIPVLLGMTVSVTDAAGVKAELPYQFFAEAPLDDLLAFRRAKLEQQEKAAAAVAARNEREAAERQRLEEIRKARVTTDQLLRSAMFVAFISLLSLPLQVPVLAVLFRAAYALELAMFGATEPQETREERSDDSWMPPEFFEVEKQKKHRDGEHLEWKPAFIMSAATSVTMIFVGTGLGILVGVWGNLMELATFTRMVSAFLLSVAAQAGIEIVVAALVLKFGVARASRFALCHMLLAVSIAGTIAGVVWGVLNWM